jgi:ADP-heptose:LPS heptosyltransferase
MGLGGYLTWTVVAKEIKKRASNNVKILPIERHGHCIKLIKSEIFKNNNDFYYASQDSNDDTYLFPIVLNDPNANYCKKDTIQKAFHRTDKHIIEQCCEAYGIENPELKCVLKLNREEENFASDFHERVLNGEKFVTIEPFSKDNYTPNRSYPIEKWQKIVNSICDKIKIVQIGNSGKILNNVVDLTCQTTFREAVAVIDKSELFLAAEGGLVHAATAVDTKSIVIITGYQSEKMVAYPQNININISSHGPCGLKITCPECQKDAENHDFKEIVCEAEKYLGL